MGKYVIGHISHSPDFEAEPKELKGKFTMAKEDHIHLAGQIVEVAKGGLFVVQCGDHKVHARLSGKLRQFKIKIVLGDSVQVAVSPYDPTRGIIQRRE